MADQKHIQTLVEQTAKEIFSSALPGLCEQISQRVIQKLAEHAPDQVPVADSGLLNAAQAAVQAGTTQVQILDAMIEGAGNFATRTALFVVRGTNAVGWRARGFSDDEAVKNSPLELSEGLAAKAIANRAPASGKSAEFIPGFADQFGASKETATVYPLVVRDKVVAVIYADGGTEQHRFDRPAMEALIRSTSLWLEVFATRKATATVISHEAAQPAPTPAPEPVVSQPAAVMAAAAAVAPVVSMPAASVTAAATGTGIAAMEPPPVVESAPVPVPVAAPSKDDEVRTKARRFAKLLVDEIKLYNQTKVSEGRQNHDLYDRLKDDIEKSRATYEKRYGNGPAKEGNFFNQELIRILGDNDPSLFGGNFPR